MGANGGGGKGGWIIFRRINIILSAINVCQKLPHGVGAWFHDTVTYIRRFLIIKCAIMKGMSVLIDNGNLPQLIKTVAINL